MPAPPPRTRRRWWWVLQLLLSAGVLGLMIRAVEPEQLRALPSRVEWGLLLLALSVKGLALLVHELRIWLVLARPRPPLQLVTRIGLVAGVANLVLPGRAGDLVNIALLKQRCRLGLGTATATMGIVAFLEAAVFGVLLLVGLVVGATQWQELIGVDAHARATRLVGLATGAGLLGATLVTLVARRVVRRETPAGGSGPGAGGGLLQVVRDATTRTDAALGTPGRALANVAVALLQVVGMVWSFAIALPAVGVDVGAPFLAAAGVLALSALSAVVLPPSFGAGPAAASLAVLSMLGADQADALAYAGAWWVLAQVPAVVLGLPSMWSLGLRLSDAPRLQATDRGRDGLTS